MMSHTQDFLLEIGSEELPPRALQQLSNALTQGIEQGLQKHNLGFSSSKSYATPRRLAVIINELQSQQDDYETTRQGPFVNVAFDADGKPTPACTGFAKSCQVEVSDLERIETDKGERLVYHQKHHGKHCKELLPEIVRQAIHKLPIPKPMRWGDSDITFIRPVHWIVMLYGDNVIEANILGQDSSRNSYGHRFHHPQAINITTPDTYESQLEKANVIADFNARRQRIEKGVQASAAQHNLTAVIEPTLLDEVTGLVEYPNPLFINFDNDFLQVPSEALIAAMADHQKCFHVVDKEQQLQAHFITVSNIESKSPETVITGNERVMRARLADAAFFYKSDLKQRLEQHLPQLEHVTFQAKLGNLYEKTVRLSQLAHTIAGSIDADAEQAARAGLLSQCDLLSHMVGEFPELQGIMGYYYALSGGEKIDVAIALKEQYLPRFANDTLPTIPVAASLALATRLDKLVGIFGINQIPSGEKDPFALRRAALGVVRIIIDKQLDVDLETLIEKAAQAYGDKLTNPDLKQQVQQFIIDRMKAHYLEQGISIDVINAVLARQSQQLFDCHRRIQAVIAFQALTEAKTLAAANKRVSRLLQKEGKEQISNGIDNNLLEIDAERELATLIQEKNGIVAPLFASGQYNQALSELATLGPSVDRFFDQVMVMVDDEKIRNNRLALLAKLRHLFLQIADISLLKSET